MELDVSVDDALGIAMLQSLDELKHDLSGLTLTEWLASCRDLLKKLATRAQLHAKVNVLVVIIGFVVLDDVGVIDLLHDLHLVLQADEILGLQLALINHLDGNLEGLIFFVTSFEYFSVRTGSQDVILIYIVGFFQVDKGGCAFDVAALAVTVTS